MCASIKRHILSDRVSFLVVSAIFINLLNEYVYQNGVIQTLSFFFTCYMQCICKEKLSRVNNLVTLRSENI